MTKKSGLARTHIHRGNGEPLCNVRGLDGMPTLGPMISARHWQERPVHIKSLPEPLCTECEAIALQIYTPERSRVHR